MFQLFIKVIFHDLVYCFSIKISKLISINDQWIENDSLSCLQPVLKPFEAT